MPHLILEHLTHHDLPIEWAKRLPTEHTFSVLIVTEKRVSQDCLNAKSTTTHTPLFGIWRDDDVSEDVEAYVRSMRRNRFKTC